MKHFFNRVVTSTLATLLPAFAVAQIWNSTKANIFMSPVAPGFSNDLIAHMRPKKLPAKLGQLVIVPSNVYMALILITTMKCTTS